MMSPSTTLLHACLLVLLAFTTTQTCSGSVVSGVSTTTKTIPKLLWSLQYDVDPNAPPTTAATLHSDPTSNLLVLVNDHSIYGFKSDGVTAYGPRAQSGTFLQPAYVVDSGSSSSEGALLVTTNMTQNDSGGMALAAYDMATGNTAWSVGISFISDVSVDATSGIVYLEMPVDKVAGFHPATGAQVSSFSIPSSNSFVGTYAGVALVTASNTETLRGIDASTGQQLWAVKCGISVVAGARLRGSVVYVTGNQPADTGAGALVIAVDVRSGKLLFSSLFAASNIYTPTLSDDGSALYVPLQLYAQDNSGTSVVALDASTGHTLWLHNTTAVIVGPAAVGATDSSHVYITTSPAYNFGPVVFTIVALQAATGATEWSFQIPVSHPEPNLLSNYQVSTAVVCEETGAVLASLYDGNHAKTLVVAVQGS